MAIFGYLTDMPLADVLSMVGRSTGKFMVWNTPSSKRYEMHLNQGMLSAMLVEEIEVSDVFQIRSRMVELMNTRTGEFEFQKQAPADLLCNFNLSIETLLLSSMAAIDEMEAYRPHFASSRTVFQIVATREAWLEGDLQEFWETCYLLLEEGASAEKIMQLTGLFIDNVLLSLYKLRTAGLIAPVRAFQNSPTQSGRLQRQPDPEYPLAVKRPVAADPVQVEAHHANGNAPGPDLRTVVVNRPEGGILSKVLNRLRLSLRGFSL